LYDGAKSATLPSSGSVITITPTVALGSSPTSSLAGGADVTVTGSGFSTEVSENTVEVCGLEAEVLSVASANSLTFRTPAFLNANAKTAYPDTFNVPQKLTGTWTGDEEENVQYVLDQQSTSYYESSSSSCEIVLDIGDGRVALLSTIRYFPRVDSVAADFIGSVF